jgi:hypothetical protein
MADAADLPDIPRPSQLWKQLNAEKKRQAADAFWQDENAANEQAEAVNLIAQRIKFRLKSVIAMPVDKKTQYRPVDAGGLRDARGADARGVSPSASTGDDGGVSRRARHPA